MATRCPECGSANVKLIKCDKCPSESQKSIGGEIERALRHCEYKCRKCGAYFTNLEPCKGRIKIEGKPCYITTATLTALNKCDDKCYELETFRWYRDNILLKEESDGKALVEEYYKTAPLIVEKINKSPERERVYKHLWEQYLKPCLEAIEKGEYKKVQELYISMVRNLQRKYLK